MEKLFLVLMLSVLCAACEKPPKRDILYAYNDECATEDFSEAEEFIPGGFWPCDWLPHPHIPNDDDSGAKMA